MAPLSPKTASGFSSRCYAVSARGRSRCSAVARFEDDDADVETEPELRNQRILRQRRAADVMKDFLGALDQSVSNWLTPE